jgi:benzoyl-CoA-dihydrodiol lyase
MKGSRALAWHLVDELVPMSAFSERVTERAEEMAAASDRPGDAIGVELTPLDRTITDHSLTYSAVSVEINRATGVVAITVNGPDTEAPPDADAATRLGADFWPLRLARELDDAFLHLRVNELELGTFTLHSRGSLEAVAAYDQFLHENASDWFIREVILLWKRLLKRIDLTSRTVLTLVEPGSCFGGFLAELVLAADRAYMFEGTLEGDDATATMLLTNASTGPFPMSNGLTRLETRFWGDDAALNEASDTIGKALTAADAYAAGLVTEIYDDIDWEDELRIIIEERASFSPDSLTAMEANLRFPGPETLETKIFGRLTAWQNWVFQRPNASGEVGALQRYGTGLRPEYDHRRV